MDRLREMRTRRDTAMGWPAAVSVTRAGSSRTSWGDECKSNSSGELTASGPEDAAGKPGCSGSSVVGLLHSFQQGWNPRAEDGGMALREFHDSKGVLWKVWSVTPDSLDKRTTAEDYMRDWQDGWLCFECQDSRRRLASFPPGWEALEDAELESLLARAQPVKRRGTDDLIQNYRKGSEESVTVAAAPAAEAPVAPSRPDAGRVTPTASAAVHSRIFTDAR